MASARFGVAFRSDQEPQRLVALARSADELGFDSFWLAEEYHYRSAVPLAALVSDATTRIKVALGILPTHTRHPALTAMEAATLDEIAGGRLVMGLGAARTAALRHGDTVSPVATMRETLTLVRRLLDGEEVSAAGQVWQLEGTKLAFPSRRGMPIYIGTFPYSPHMLRLAGELADGVVLVWASPDWIRRAREEIATGAARVGRDPAEVDVAAYIVLSVDEDPNQARDACRPLIAAYAERAVRWVESGLVTEEDLEPIRAARASGGAEAAAAAVDDRLVEKIAIAGDPAYCRDRLAEFRSAGLDLPIAYQVIGPDPFEAMRLLSRTIISPGA
jgi:5,10-methylenetetrahydromethanopterin reductase